MLMRKRESIEHFFGLVYEEVAQQPYALHFYLSYSKELIKQAESF